MKADVIAFAIDQQPCLQGYLPVVILTNLARYGVVPSGHINSGPGFITRANIGLVEQYAGEYRRGRSRPAVDRLPTDRSRVD